MIEAMKMQNSLTAVKQAKVNMSVLTKALGEFKVHVLRGLQHNSVLGNARWNYLKQNAHMLLPKHPMMDHVCVCVSRLRMSTVNQGRQWERETCWWRWNRTRCQGVTSAPGLALICLHPHRKIHAGKLTRFFFSFFLPPCVYKWPFSKDYCLEGVSQLSCISCVFSTCLPPLCFSMQPSGDKTLSTFFFKPDCSCFG